ncbi:MAG: hypothetical protein VB035_10085 [Candidatus Fimivivens sp.]|nr:hypothetical protein [Candidatus Fimivivens sp.]
MPIPKHKLTLLQISSFGESPNSVSWQPSGELWASVEQQDKTNLFSKVGVGVKSALITMVPRGDITLHDALIWNGKHLFLTGINIKSPAAMEITAALIEPTMCSATRGKDTKNALNNPVRVQEALCSFPACVTEKYMGFSVQQPQSQVEETLVLVCPKTVVLKTGDLVTVGTRGVYAVTVPHTLDDYKNEYEVVATKEA